MAVILEMKPISSLEKVFLDSAYESFPEHRRQSALWGEWVNFQMVIHTAGIGHSYHMKASVASPLATDIQLFEVGQVPCQLPCYEGPATPGWDDNYLRTTPGLFPDPLYDTCSEGFRVPWGQCVALWVRLKVPVGTPAGDYPVTVSVSKIDERENATPVLEEQVTVQVIPAEAPAFTAFNSQWIHYDCLATYYRVPVFSEEHWRLIGNYYENAVEYGMTAVFLPLVTPELDTQVGTYRPVVQLVDVTIQNGHMTLGLEKLDRMVNLALEKGFRYFELSHLFSQWGATSAPQVMATVDGEYKRIFGWETPSTDPDFLAFLRQMLTEVLAYFRRRGLDKQCRWHVADEPGGEHLAQYLEARRGIDEVLKDEITLDAVGEYEFYAKGIIKCPVVSINHLEPFFENNATNFYGYYCCGQDRDVSNRFIAMPSARTRILGLQLYKYRQITGFMQWGYNFWYSQLSRKAVNPFLVTDGHAAFPSGDTHSVYPAEDGTAIPSLRQAVFQEGLQDLQALKLLETVMPRQELLELLEKRSGERGLTMTRYPTGSDWLMETREVINALIAERCC